ncbi:transmembrane amino acid transporter protein-domain-containing protein [Fomes fomentarius]|nr:transmembrane amino acid transporter protein-domain-containing protein [Fomes fomentarius]
MSSIPAAILSSSYQSATSVIDVLESYRRAQTQHSDFVSGSLSSSSAQSALPDPEAIHEIEQEEQDIDDHFPHPTRERPPPTGDDPILANIQWDEDLTPLPPFTQSRPYESRSTPTLASSRWPRTSFVRDEDDLPTPRVASGERTPLLLKPSPSQTSLGRRQPIRVQDQAPHYTALQHRISSASVRSKASLKPATQGHSTFAQTLLNAVAVLFGIGMLSEPLAFAYAGWVGGTVLIIGYGLISCYTAKILARIVLEDPHIRSYADIGRKAFGPRSMPLISTIFGLELFTVTVALVTLYADSLHAVVPRYSSDTYKILGLVVLIPAVLMPLSVLSYASIIGIFSLMAIIGIILFDGFTKFDSPGSLWSPADTSLGVDSFQELGIAFGLFMAGFSGHAVIPTLARDMIDPTQFDEMINWAFVIATGIYGLLGVAGYIMFGNSVSDEFSVDLVKHNVHPALNTVALWGLVITPLSKFALTARPLNITIEMLLGIDTAGSSSGDHAHDPAPTSASPSAFPSSSPQSSKPNVKALFVALERTLLTLVAVAVSILVPEFASIMAVLGSTFSFVLCIIGPVSAKLALEGGLRRCVWSDGALLVVSTGMAVWGTVCAFASAAPAP